MKTKPIKPKRIQSFAARLKQAKTIWRQQVTISRADQYGFCRCITCNDRWPYYAPEMHAGHYYHGRLNVYFTIMNCHPQCYRCNYHGKGRPRDYALYMFLAYGPENMLWLHHQAQIPRVFERWELDRIIDEARIIVRLHGGKPAA